MDVAQGSAVTGFIINALPLDCDDTKTVFCGCCIGHKAICTIPVLPAWGFPVYIRELGLTVARFGATVSLYMRRDLK